MTEQMSALIDGELDAIDEGRLRACLKSFCENAPLRCDWALAHLIGDHLRGDSALTTGFASRLRQRLAAEPTVVAAGRVASRQAPWWLALSVAASVIGVAIVCWAVLAINSPQALEVAIAPASASAAAPPVLPVGRYSVGEPRRPGEQRWRPTLVDVPRQP